MPQWLRKSLVVLISVFTFGMVTPAQASELLSIDQQRNGDETDLIEVSSPESENIIIDEIPFHRNFIDQIKQEAVEKSFEKFGNRIGPVIQDEFLEMILPNIEAVIDTLASDLPEGDLEYLTITEVPPSGQSEKIFHIVGKENRELIQFHVRRDKPPHEGYWFNFHYHTFHDQFETHYELGAIYWDKNTPPHWRT